jgi:hypothetical protein
LVISVLGMVMDGEVLVTVLISVVVFMCCKSAGCFRLFERGRASPGM